MATASSISVADTGIRVAKAGFSVVKLSATISAPTAATATSVSIALPTTYKSAPVPLGAINVVQSSGNSYANITATTTSTATLMVTSSEAEVLMVTIFLLVEAV